MHIYRVFRNSRIISQVDYLSSLKRKILHRFATFVTINGVVIPRISVRPRDSVTRDCATLSLWFLNAYSSQCQRRVTLDCLFSLTLICESSLIKLV